MHFFSMQEFHQLLADINKQKFARVYLLSGTESYFIDAISDALMANVVDESAQDFDQTIVYGKDTSVAEILDAVKRYPMVGQHHLVMVREAQNLDRIMDDALAEALKNPPASSVLVLCYKNKAVDKRKKLYKTVQKTGIVQTFKALYENQVPSWIQKRASTMRLNMPPQSAFLLAECLGSNLNKIERELEKLKLAVPEGSEVNAALIEEHIGFSKEFNNFELQKAIGMRQSAKSYQIVRYMIQNPKNHPLPLTLSTLHSFFQKVLLYHGLSNRSKAAETLGVNSYFVKDYETAARNFSMKQVGKALRLLFEADIKSKGIKGRNDHALILENLILQFSVL